MEGPNEMTLNRDPFHEANFIFDKTKNPGYGATIGRVAGKISNAEFTLENGHFYPINKNDGLHSKDGGEDGYSRVEWDTAEIVDDVDLEITIDGKKKKGSGVKFSRTSEHIEDQGYPGSLYIEVAYIVTPDDELHVIHKAKLIEPTPRGTMTPINLSNYIYWNLSGNFKETDVKNHQLRLPSSTRYIEVDPDLIPTGEFEEADASNLDFKESFVKLNKNNMLSTLQVAKNVNTGLNHQFLIDGADPEDLAPKKCKIAAQLIHDRNIMNVYTTQPSVWVYTANDLPTVDHGEEKQIHTKHSSICIAPMNYADAINKVGKNEWPEDGIALKKDQTYEHVTIYKFFHFTDVKGLVHEQIVQNPVVIYSKTFCPYSNETKLLFKEYQIEAKIVEMDLEAEGEAIHSEVRELSGYDQTPNIFIAGKHVGGYQDIENAFDSGRLVILLNEAGVKHTIGESLPLYVEDEMIVEYFNILKDQSKGIEDRMDALCCLKEIDDVDSIHVLIEAFKKEKDSEFLQYKILYCLGQMNITIAHNVLIQEFLEQVVEGEFTDIVVREAIESLANISEEKSLRLIKKFMEEWECTDIILHTAELAFELINWNKDTRFGKQEGLDLKEDLKFMTNDPAPPFNYLKDENYAEIEPLLKIVLDPEDSLFRRHRALFTLRELYSAESCHAISSVLQPKYSSICSDILKRQICFELGQMTNCNTVASEPLFQVAQNQDEAEIVRLEAILALGNIVEDTSTLEEFLQQDIKIIQEAAKVAIRATLRRLQEKKSDQEIVDGKAFSKLKIGAQKFSGGMDSKGIFRGMGLRPDDTLYIDSQNEESSAEDEFDPSYPQDVDLIANDLPQFGEHKTVKISINSQFFNIDTGINSAKYKVRDILSATVDRFKPHLVITLFANEDVITTSEEQGPCCRVYTRMKTKRVLRHLTFGFDSMPAVSRWWSTFLWLAYGFDQRQDGRPKKRKCAVIGELKNGIISTILEEGWVELTEINMKDLLEIRPGDYDSVIALDNLGHQTINTLMHNRYWKNLRDSLGVAVIENEQQPQIAFNVVKGIMQPMSLTRLKLKHQKDYIYMRNKLEWKGTYTLKGCGTRIGSLVSHDGLDEEILHDLPELQFSSLLIENATTDKNLCQNHITYKKGESSFMSFVKQLVFNSDSYNKKSYNWELRPNQDSINSSTYFEIDGHYYQSQKVIGKFLHNEMQVHH